MAAWLTLALSPPNPQPVPLSSLVPPPTTPDLWEDPSHLWYPPSKPSPAPSPQAPSHPCYICPFLTQVGVLFQSSTI